MKQTAEAAREDRPSAEEHWAEGTRPGDVLGVFGPGSGA
jgi:hypothetical protein